MVDPTRRTALRWGAVALAGGLVTVTAACGNDTNSVAEQAKAGDRKGYVAGDGSIEQLAVDQRGEPVTILGTTLEGEPWSMKGLEDTVLVINVWGSWCPPCIAETPDLQKAWEKVQATKLPVQFIGMDKLESPETGLAFLKAQGVTYPSLAYEGGRPDPRPAGQGVGHADDDRARPGGTDRGTRLRPGLDARRCSASSTTCSPRRPDRVSADLATGSLVRSPPRSPWRPASCRSRPRVCCPSCRASSAT